MRAAGLCLLLMLGACYRPAQPSGRYLCASSEDCPSHHVCSGGLCVDPGGAGVDLDGGADLSGTDMGEVCPGWIAVSAPEVYACRRHLRVREGDYGGLCRSGFHVCDLPDNLAALSSSALTTTCGQAGSFFATRIDIAIARVTDMNPRRADGNCAPQGPEMDRALLGCGSSNDLYSLNSNGCHGLGKALRCLRAPQGWECSSVRKVDYSGSQGGVLCCRDR